MADDKAKKQPDKSELLPPEQAASSGNINILAVIQNSDNPKKMLEFLEEHRPGTINRLIEKAEAFADQSQASRFKFGERQAYTTLASGIVFGLIACAAVFYALHLKAGLSILIGLAILFAITQSGSRIWRKIGNALVSRITKDK